MNVALRRNALDGDKSKVVHDDAALLALTLLLKPGDTKCEQSWKELVKEVNAPFCRPSDKESVPLPAMSFNLEGRNTNGINTVVQARLNSILQDRFNEKRPGYSLDGESQKFLSDVAAMFNLSSAERHGESPADARKVVIDLLRPTKPLDSFYSDHLTAGRLKWDDIDNVIKLPPEIRKAIVDPSISHDIHEVVGRHAIAMAEKYAKLNLDSRTLKALNELGPRLRLYVDNVVEAQSSTLSDTRKVWEIRRAISEAQRLQIPSEKVDMFVRSVKELSTVFDTSSVSSRETAMNNLMERLSRHSQSEFGQVRFKVVPDNELGQANAQYDMSTGEIIVKESYVQKARSTSDLLVVAGHELGLHLQNIQMLRSIACDMGNTIPTRRSSPVGTPEFQQYMTRLCRNYESMTGYKLQPETAVRLLEHQSASVPNQTDPHGSRKLIPLSANEKFAAEKYFDSFAMWRDQCDQRWLAITTSQKEKLQLKYHLLNHELVSYDLDMRIGKRFSPRENQSNGP